MILVDSSVVIDYLRGKDPKLQALIPALPVGVCGITRAEVLAGRRDASHRQNLMTTLGAFQTVLTPEVLWDDVGENFAALRTGGVTVPFQDVVIATVAIGHDVELWARDVQFAHIQRVLPALKLFQEPP